MAGAVVTYDDATHTYCIGGERVPSVTEIAGLVTAQKYGGNVGGALTQAAQRGTAIHEYTELIDYGVGLEDMEIYPESAPYIQAYTSFLRDYSPQWLYIERIVSNATEGYAGRLDRLGIIDGSPVVVDLKTGGATDRLTRIKWAVQLEGYRRAMPEYRGAKRMTLLLRNNGKYTIYDSGKSEERYGFDSVLLFSSLLTLAKLIGGYKT